VLSALANQSLADEAAHLRVVEGIAPGPPKHEFPLVSPEHHGVVLALGARVYPFLQNQSCEFHTIQRLK
jgi:hypothetical protein